MKGDTLMRSRIWDIKQIAKLLACLHIAECLLQQLCFKRFQDNYLETSKMSSIIVNIIRQAIAKTVNWMLQCFHQHILTLLH